MPYPSIGKQNTRAIVLLTQYFDFIFELADKITEITGKKLEYVSNILPVDDPQKRCPDIAFAKDKLNWEPKIPLSKGLLPTLKWFQVCLNE